MKSSRPWFKPLAVLAATSLTWANPAAANEANPTAPHDFSNSQASIEIYVPPPENNATPTCSAGLKAKIDSIVSSRPNNWGVLVESLTDRTPIYAHNADKYFIPASNIKLFTTAAALQRLNPEASIRSKSLKHWITVTNRNSNNYYADTLLRHIGGAKVAKSALANLGVNPGSYRLADGSGLSRRNVATPRALVETLRAMYYGPGNSLFQSSLPVAGVSGTLRNRLRRTPAQGMVYAKTGTLRGVRALSGYLNHPQYGIVVFSILANDSSRSGTTLVKTIDRIVLQMSSSNLSCQ